MPNPNFASILNESPTEIERPTPMPQGTYLCTVGQWEPGESSKKKTPFIKFPLRPLAAMEDVNADDLEAAGGLEGRALSITFYITDEAKFILDQFHVNCGVDLAEAGTRAQRNDDVVNSQVLAVVSHRIDDQDPSRVFTEVRRTARAD